MSCELNMLSDIARIKLQAAYSYFASGHKHKLIDIMRIIPSIFHQLEKTNHQLILTNFIPAITGGILLCQPRRTLPSVITRKIW